VGTHLLYLSDTVMAASSLEGGENILSSKPAFRERDAGLPKAICMAGANAQTSVNTRRYASKIS